MSQTFASGGGVGQVSVTAGNGCAWTATSGAPWVTITAGTQGTGNGSVAYTVDANTGGARSTTLTIAGLTFTVMEADTPAPPPPPPACAYSVSPTAVSVGAGGGVLGIDVTTLSGCSWTAVSNVSWMTITSHATGTGSATVGVSIARNNNAERIGTLTVAGQTVTVTEAAGKNGGGDNHLVADASWEHIEPR